MHHLLLADLLVKSSDRQSGFKGQLHFWVFEAVFVQEGLGTHSTITILGAKGEDIWWAAHQGVQGSHQQRLCFVELALIQAEQPQAAGGADGLRIIIARVRAEDLASRFQV